jgi:O-antigen/teichoic acid export membrane protein
MYKQILLRINTKEFNNLKSLLISYLIKFFVGLFLNIWIIRSLGEENFGIFSYVTSLTGIFSIISTFGLQTVIITSILNSKINQIYSVISNAFIISLITGIIAAIAQLLFVLYYNLGEMAIIYLCLINLIIYFFDTFKILTYYYEAKVESAIVAKINNYSFLTCTLVRIIILYNNLNFYYLAFSYVLDYIITAFLLYYTFPKTLFNLFKINFQKEISLKIIYQSLPFLLSGLFINFFMKIDLIMIKNLLNNKETGIFATSVKLTEIWYFIPGLVQSTFFPSLFGSIDNPVSYKVKIIRLYKLMIYFSLIIIIIITFFGKYIILKLFGQNYIESYNPLLVHIWAILFVSISVIRNSKLFALGLSKIFFQITLIGAILNLILCYFMIKKYGIIGASMATVISYFVIAYGLNFFYKDLREEMKNINLSFITLFKK